MGSAMHELMHALGFHHEHCRQDRNQHVTVKRTGRNYDPITSGVTSYSTFDYESIMSYSREQGVELRSDVNVNVKLGL